MRLFTFLLIIVGNSLLAVDYAPFKANISNEIDISDLDHKELKLLLEDSLKELSTSISLHEKKSFKHLKPYIRTEYMPFKKWGDENKNSIKTRSEVLMRDLRPKTKFSSIRKFLNFEDPWFESRRKKNPRYKANKTKVVDIKKSKRKKYYWLDSFTNEKFYSADKVDIDHVVPLKNAHIFGGSKWPSKIKYSYANYMDNNHHLLVVELGENRSKNDKGPSIIDENNYLPPNKGYHCNYVRIWAQIKYEWQLSLSFNEHDKVIEILNQKKCLSSLKTLLKSLQKEPILKRSKNYRQWILKRKSKNSYYK